MGLFGRSRFTDPDVEDWTFQVWAWLMRNQDGMRRIAWARLVTPERDFFPASDSVGHARAQHVLRCVLRAMNFGSIECDLQPVERQARVALSGIHGSALDAREISGGYHKHEGRLVIEYEPSLLDDPTRLVAVLAHQLCRYEISHITEAVPDGHEALNLAADMAIAHHGLGIFGANAAFEFRTGVPQVWGAAYWQASYCGFLSEETWALGLAIFLALKNDPGKDANAWLEPTARSLTHDALHYLAKHQMLLEPLRAIA